MTPDFLICGAQRCGTTSMFKTVMQHPQAARPFLRKGIHFFDVNYERGFDWYQAHFPIATTSQLRRGGTRPITGESSPYYLFHPRALERVATDLPQAKVVVLLRDPVERAYSAHSHERARGFERLPFELAVRTETERLGGEYERMSSDPGYESFEVQHHAYVQRGQYVDQLLRAEALIGRQRLLVVDSGDFFENPAPAFDEVLSFLGLPPAKGIRFERHNARRRSTLPETLRQELERQFAPFDQRLTEWWGRTPSWRRG